MSSFNNFKTSLCAKSESADYLDAVNEWVFLHRVQNDRKCICGVKIHYEFHISNILNGNKLIVGSVCIKKFLTGNETLIKNVKKAIYNDKCKTDDKLYRKCETCDDKYKILSTDDHDILLECYECNPLSHVNRFNDLCNKQNIAIRKCIDCGKRYNLKDGKMNGWQIRCYGCYMKIK